MILNQKYYALLETRVELTMDLPNEAIGTKLNMYWIHLYYTDGDERYVRGCELSFNKGDFTKDLDYNDYYDIIW